VAESVWRAAGPNVPRAAQVQQQRRVGGISNEGFLGQINRGIVGAVAGIPDIVGAPIRMGAEALGYEMPTMADTMSDLLRGLGVAVARDEAQDMPSRIGEGIGLAAGSIVPGGALVRGMQQYGGPVARGIAETMMAPFTRTPVRALGVEAAAGGAAGAGGLMAERAAEDTVVPGGFARGMGELAGGLTGAGLPAAVGAAGRSILDLAAQAPGVVGMLGRTTQQFADPATAAFNRAGEELRRRLDQPVADTLAALEAPSVLGLTNVQRTGQTELLRLEQDLLASNPVLARRYADSMRDARATARTEFEDLGAGGDVQDTVRAMQDWLDTSAAALNESADEAIRAANAAIRRAGPTTEQTPAAMSEVFRTELEAAQRRARAEESALWSQVPDSFAVPTSRATAAYESELARMTDVGESAGLMPEMARRWLDPNSPDYFGDAASPPRLQALRTSLNDAATAARARGEPAVARVAGNLARAITEDIDSVAQVGGPFDVARTFSRALNDAFTRGPIGRVLAQEHMGAPRVAPETTLRTLMGQGDEPGIYRSRAIEIALGRNAPGGGSREGLLAADNYLRRRFSEAIAPEPDILNVPAGQRFIRTRADMMEEYPMLGRILEDAVEAATLAQTTRRTVDQELAALSRGPQATLASAGRHREFEAILNTPDPEQSLLQIMGVAQEAGPDAVQGMRAAAADYLLSGATARRHGELALSGDSILSALDQPRVAAAMETVLGPDALSRVRAIGQELTVLDRSAAARSSDPRRIFEPTAADTILNAIAGVFGAGAGRALGTGTIQTPGITASFARGLARRMTSGEAQQLLTDAVTRQDPDLFRALLTGQRQGPEAVQRAQEVITLWMAANASRTEQTIEGALEDFEAGLGLR
jgi:hypothetical protein